MAFTLANPIGTGTDQELLDYARACMARILAHGVAYDNKGKSLTQADLPDIRATIEWLESRVNTAANGMSVNYVRRLRPQ